MSVTANLCQCNKCNIILIDQNPQIGAKEYPLTGNESEMQYKQDETGGYWVCPVCESDDHLQDEITIGRNTFRQPVAKLPHPSTAEHPESIIDHSEY